MKNKITLLLFSLLYIFPSLTLAQQRVVDQLLPRLDTLEENKEKVDVLLALARAYGFIGDSNLETQYVEAGKQLSQKLNYKKGIGLALVFQSILEFNHGQDQESDETLLRAIKIAQEIDSKDFQLMCDYLRAESFIYGINDYKTGIEILTKSLAQVDETVSTKNIANAYQALATAFMAKGDTTQALQMYEHTISLLSSYQERPFIEPDLGKESAQLTDGGAMNLGFTYENMSELFQDAGKLEIALSYSQKALQIYETWDTPFCEASAAVVIGNIMVQQGKTDEALPYYQAAQAKAEQINNIHFIGIIKFNIGDIYHVMGDYEAAEELYLSSLTTLQQTNDSLSLWDVYQRLGALEYHKGHFDQAENWFIKGMEIAQSLQDSISIADNAGHLGSLALLKQDYQLGESYLKLALHIYQDLNKTINIPNALLNISSLFEQQLQPDSAMFYAQLAFGIAQKNGDNLILQKNHSILSRLYEKREDFQLALYHYQQFFTYYENVYNENLQQLAKEEQVRQNVLFYKKEQATAEANVVLLKQRNQLYFALGSTFLLLFLASGYLFLRLRKSKQTIEFKNQQLMELNQAKDKFFSIIAHDIRSPMVALQSVGRQMNFFLKRRHFEKIAYLADMVTQTTDRLDTLLDNLLNWALLQRGLIIYQPTSLSIKQSVTEVSDLFAGSLEAKAIQLKTHISTDHLVKADKVALHTILRNLMSNAVKFTPEKGLVAIHSEEKNDQVFLRINNSGSGIPTENLKNLFSLTRKSTKGTAGEKGTGLGLILCKELIELNHGKISAFNQIGKGATFVFSLPRV